MTRVLLADDSDGLRLVLRSVLAAADDLEVVAEARDGQEAVDLVETACPDVVVLDVAMPVVDGLQALSELRRRYPSLPVVMVSGFAEQDVALQAAARGAHALVDKTGDLDRLVEAVRSAAAGAPDRRPVPQQRTASDEPAAPVTEPSSAG